MARSSLANLRAVCTAKEKHIPRTYRSVKRKQLEEEIRQRIVEATVALHAEKGGAATSYRDIAQKADVAVPTVYKNFPNMSHLLSACTGHAVARAPAQSEQIFEGKKTLKERVASLVEIRCKVHTYFDPWLKWGGERVVPEIGATIEKDISHAKKLVQVALAPFYRKGAIPAEIMSMTLLLLSYHSWSTLRYHLGLSQKELERQLTNSICKLIEG